MTTTTYTKTTLPSAYRVLYPNDWIHFTIFSAVQHISSLTLTPQLRSDVRGCGDVGARPTRNMYALGSIPARDPVGDLHPWRDPRGSSTEAMSYAVPGTLDTIG